MNLPLSFYVLSSNVPRLLSLPPTTLNPLQAKSLCVSPFSSLILVCVPSHFHSLSPYFQVLALLVKILMLVGFEQVLPGSSCAYFWHHQGYGHWMTFWLVVIWLIWLQRNTIIFRGKQACVQEVVDSVVFKTWSWVKAYYARDTFSFSD